MLDIFFRRFFASHPPLFVAFVFLIGCDVRRIIRAAGSRGAPLHYAFAYARATGSPLATLAAVSGGDAGSE